MARLAVALLWLVLCVAPAVAKPAGLVVAPFAGGPGARTAEAAALRVAKARPGSLPPAAWDYAAKRLKLSPSTTRAEDVQAIAASAGAQLVITGALRGSGRAWELAVSVRDGKTGKAGERLSYPLRSGRPDATTLRTLARELAAALDAAEAPPPPPPPRAANPALTDPDEADRQAAQAEATPQPTPERRPARAATPKHRVDDDVGARPVASPPPALAVDPSVRPRWRPFVRAGVGLSLTGRTFDFDPSSLPKFSTGAAIGLHVEAWLFPLAFTHNTAKGVFAGLGLGGTLDKPFWPDATPRLDPTQRYATVELRIEGMLRWNIQLASGHPRPTLIVVAGGGQHNFLIGKATDNMGNLVDVGPPDVNYRYLTVGLGLRLQPVDLVSLWFLANYHQVLLPGPVTGLDEFGPARVYAYRAQGGLDFAVWKYLEVTVSGFYENFRYVFFPGKDDPPAKTGSAASDAYFGAMLSVLFRY